MRGHNTSVSLPCVTVTAPTRTITPVPSQASQRTYSQSNGLEVDKRKDSHRTAISVRSVTGSLSTGSHTPRKSGTTKCHSNSVHTTAYMSLCII